MVLEFGIFDSFDLAHGGVGELLDGRLRFAQEVERLGFAHYHVTEHHGTPLSVCPSPNLFVAALSRLTDTMRLGTVVNVLPAYEPFRLAEEIATLDQLTHGRLDFGVGSGISPLELGILGVRGDQAREIYQETLTAVTHALKRGRMTHRGTLLRDYDAALSVAPVQTPYPQLWYASGSAVTAEWAAANGINFVTRWEGGAVAEVGTRFWAAWDKHRGDDDRLNPITGQPRFGISGPVVVAGSQAEADDVFGRANELHERRLLQLWHEYDDHRLDGVFSAQHVLEKGNGIVGTADSVRDEIVAQVETSGVNYLELKIIFGDLGVDDAIATARTMIEHVAPAARAAADKAARRLGLPVS
ncbi:LLM class flavin-dependent oxidoreductase [Amycolatopsis sp. FDAARGOS 1241]|uniref:LLM class flavin-dependent oxidoreductase n=1 Tax=Amycolatopsis sp. FDAARGOS 1241 TaxID=2778070 RepID=UPI0019528E2C|nr:LLM class flavin-dependent oxidoreductase [Amycolatopsis sp. FDAARGOS 1241]QRP50320.1 LLM class flavin-dependent oxidoreductase [Amycolatopsis sp. FDAARGOS 1241]